MPTVEERVDAWVTLHQLHQEAITGDLVTRRFDTPTALSQAMRTIQVSLEQETGRDHVVALFDAYDARIASTHA